MKTILFSDVAIEDMAAVAALDRSLEQGGLLFGNFNNTDGLPEVLFSTSGGIPQKQNGNTYQPNQDFVHGAIHGAASASLGSVDFMGFWHSHPQGGIEPSPADLVALHDMKGIDGVPLFMVICELQGEKDEQSLYFTALRLEDGKPTQYQPEGFCLKQLVYEVQEVTRHSIEA